MNGARIEYHDDGPDRLGRRHFSLRWTDPESPWIDYPSKVDGKPVGHRRAQHFFCDPGEYANLPGVDDWHPPRGRPAPLAHRRRNRLRDGGG